ncbi:fhkE [Symbiodinium sp. KB8]|nr:fhkE [Symbiodinium sp. KB8]
MASQVEILRLVGQHRNVVSLLDAFETEPAVELVFELMEGGELFERLVSKGPYKEARALVIIKHLADALAFIHSKGVVHRDLKPENLLLDCADEKRALVKLADFGLSHLLGPGTTHMTTVCGTWAYSAPEVRINRQKYTHKVDTWSLGVIMFVVLSGYHPFDPDGVAPEEELQRNIKYGNVDFDDDVWTGVSGAAQDLIRRLLVVDPRRRYDTGDILAHPWITKNRHLWEEPPTGNRPPTARKADTTREAQAVGPSSMGSPPAGEPDSSAAGVGSAFILSPTADSHDEAIAAAANEGIGTFVKHHSSSSSAVAAAAAAPASLVLEASGEAERVPQAFGAMRHATAESGARTSSDLPQQSDADESCVGAVSVTPFMVAEAPTHLPPRHAASTQSSAAGRKIVLPPLESASTGAESKQTSAFQGVGPVLRTPSGRDIHFDTIQSTASAPSQARSQAAAEATASPPD